LRPGWGHAGHSTTNPPWDVPSTPRGCWPCPARFIDNMFCQRQNIRWASV
jgi:hypothetical protein